MAGNGKLKRDPLSSWETAIAWRRSTGRDTIVSSSEPGGRRGDQDVPVGRDPPHASGGRRSEEGDCTSLDPWRGQIERWLSAEPRLTAKRIHRLLLPMTGPVPARTVRRYVAALRASGASRIESLLDGTASAFRYSGRRGPRRPGQHLPGRQAGAGGPGPGADRGVRGVRGVPGRVSVPGGVLRAGQGVGEGFVRPRPAVEIWSALGAVIVIDRIVRHAAVLQTTGDSYRLAAAKRNRRPAAGKREAR